MFEEMNDLLAADADYVVWVESLEVEAEERAYWAWANNQAEIEAERMGAGVWV